jgi:hypothetical protein|tara:strand:+ start:159 stop:1352 length:1194 start_codon:yes stop_codon:yes gene_type:complete
MAQVQYHLTDPESTMVPFDNDTSLGGYQPFQTIDFNLATPGRKLLKNSIRIEGRIVARTASTDKWQPDAAIDATSSIDLEDNIKLDNVVGAHAFFDSWTCETQSKGILENLQNYPRFVSQHGRATLGADDMLSSKLIAECRGPYEANGNYVLQPVADQAFVTGSVEQPGQRSKPSFSIKPMICFNRQAGGDYSFDRNGFIRISCILAANRHVLFGGEDPANYVLDEVVCRFMTIPDDGTDEPMLMRSYVNVVSSLQSTASTISARVPSQQVNSVSMSFAKQSNLQSTEFCSTALEALPEWDSLEYLFANSMQNFITYRITDRDDALRRGLQSMESAGHSQVSAKTLKANRGVLYGLDFEEYVDLSQQKFTINLKILDASVTTEPFDVFLYFNSLLQL